MNSADGQITRALAAYSVRSRFEQLPEAVVHEARRALVNWAGCAVGGSSHESLVCAWNALAPFAGTSQAGMLGTSVRTDILHAALLNGISSHVLDFDDTHPEALVHPSGPVASAVLALAEHRQLTGREVINAFVTGVEVQCRVARSVLPEHYERGWHITATAGVFGAAAASARLLGISEQQAVWALGLAATQAAGLREMFGSMAKSFHVGRAAQNGLASALMAEANFSSAEAGVEGKRGFAHVLSGSVDLSRCTDGLGTRYDLLSNMYKPYACGLVMHPTIDGCIQLRDEGVRATDVEHIDIVVDPIVLEVTANASPASGLESKFSIYHAAAVALIDGAADEFQFCDSRALAADVVALRSKVLVTARADMPRDAANLTAFLHDGRKLEISVDHCRGSLMRPLSDSEIDRKFERQCVGVLGSEQTGRALSLLRALDACDEIGRCISAMSSLNPWPRADESKGQM